MAILDLVKWNGSADSLAWKFPSEELSTATQLVVNESQEAFLVRGGVYEGPFGAGRHTLATENIPILRSFLGIPFGGTSPFSAEVWFVNKTTNLMVKWGTSDPIQLQDPKFGVMVPVRAFGQYGIRINHSKKFLLKLVGTVKSFDTTVLEEYFRGTFTTFIKASIANLIKQQKTSILDVNKDLVDLSNQLRDQLGIAMNDYGVSLVQFNINSINIPEDDEAVQKLKSALAKRAEMEILGFDYRQERSFNILEAAAANEGPASVLAGAGMGLGVGLGLGPAMGAAISNISTNISNPNGSAVQPGAASSPSQSAPSLTTPTNNSGASGAVLTIEKIQILKELAELNSQGILSDAEFALEKQKLLNQ